MNSIEVMRKALEALEQMCCWAYALAAERAGVRIKEAE